MTVFEKQDTNMSRSFDSIASSYQLLETLAFGRSLQRIRTFCLPWAKDRQRALLIGDGDGRFASALLESAPRIQVDSIDLSPRMLALSQQRVGRHASRFKPIQADALAYSYPTSRYDFIALHFVLDCFTQPQIDTLLPRIEKTLKPGGIIAHSDFLSEKPWQKAIAWALYRAFRLSTQLNAYQLPIVTWSGNLRPLTSTTALRGLLFSSVVSLP